MPDVAIALAKALSLIFIVGFAGGFLVRRKIISQKDIESLSHLTVMVLLPCLMFSKINLYFKPDEFPYWWLLPLAAIAIIGLGLIISFLFYIKKWRLHKHHIAMASVMNANYMVLPIAKIAFADHYDLFASFCFLFVIGVNPTLWSLGKYLITNGNGEKVTWRTFITPPLMATLISLFLVLTTLNRFIPEIIVKPIDFIGEAAVPMATLILGATIGSVQLRKLPALSDISRVIAVKLVLLPAIVILIVWQMKLNVNYPIVADLLVIEAAVAPASQLVVQVRKYGGPVQDVGSMMLISYMVCLLTIPFWFAVWRLVAPV